MLRLCFKLLDLAKRFRLLLTQERQEEFESVLEKLPFPGHLLRIDDATDVDGNVYRSYIWQYMDSKIGERTSAFRVSDGKYIEEFFRKE